MTGTIGDNWTDGQNSSGSLTQSGSASISLTVTNDASYSGSGTFTAFGAVSGSGTITESGHLHTGDSPVLDDTTTAAGGAQPLTGTGSGAQSGSTFWSYAGSGRYTDPGAGSGIAFFTPNSTSGSGSGSGSGSFGSSSAATTISASVSGTAWASGTLTGTLSGNWTDGASSNGEITQAGSAATTLIDSNDASYSGSGSFTAFGAVMGGGTITESGSQHTGHTGVSDYQLNAASGQWQLQGGSGSGSESGSTFWSYSGSGSYTDAAVVSGIPAFPSPISGTLVNSGLVHGTAYTSGADSTTSEDSWSASENGSGNWSYSGSGRTTAADSATLSYVGSGSFTQSISDGHGGSLWASGTVSESGSSQTTANYHKDYQLGASGAWSLQDGSGTGDLNWCSGWSYAGSGNYSYPNSSGSGMVTGSTSASGGVPYDPDEPMTYGTGGNAPDLPPAREQGGPREQTLQMHDGIPVKEEKLPSSPQAEKEREVLFEAAENQPAKTETPRSRVKPKLGELEHSIAWAPGHEPPLMPHGVRPDTSRSPGNPSFADKDSPTMRWWHSLSREEQQEINDELAKIESEADKEAYLWREYNLATGAAGNRTDYEAAQKQWNEQVNKLLELGRKEEALLKKQLFVDPYKNAVKWLGIWDTQLVAHLRATRRNWFQRRLGMDEYPPNDPKRVDFEKKIEAARNIIRKLDLYEKPDFEISAAGEAGPLTAEGRALWNKYERLKQIAGMKNWDKFKHMLKLATTVKDEEGKTLLSAEMGKRIDELISGTSAAILAGTLAVWGASHYFGVGEVVDVLLAIVGYALLGTDALQISADLFISVKTALYARTDGDFERASRLFASGLSKAARDLATAGVVKVGSKTLPKVPKLVKDIKANGLTPVLKNGVVGLGRRFRTFLRNGSGTEWCSADARALDRILRSQGKSLSPKLAAELEEAANAGRMGTEAQAQATFRKLLENEGLDWSKLSKGAQQRLTGIAARFAGQGFGACFAVGTRLLTPEGSKLIEEFVAGDWVLSRDENDLQGPIKAMVVEAVFVRTGRILHLHVSGQLIRTTGEHPFWVKEKGWQQASLVQPGDLLCSPDGQWVAVEAAFETGKWEQVYNLRVAEFHTYFVGCDEWGFSVWAHNDYGTFLRRLGGQNTPQLQALYRDLLNEMSRPGITAAQRADLWRLFSEDPLVVNAIRQAQEAGTLTGHSAKLKSQAWDVIRQDAANIAERRITPTPTDRLKEQLFERPGTPKSASSVRGAQTELAGGEVEAAKARRVKFDHVTKVRNAERGLRNRIAQLKRELQNPNLVPNEQVLIEAELSEASRLLTVTEGIVPPE